MEVKESSIKGFAGNGGGTSFGARFVHFCKNDLSLEDIEIGEQTLKLVEQLKGLLVANASVSGTGTTDEVERYWFACILYVAKRLNENDGPSKKGLKLCQILRAAKLNVTDFYKELGQFLIKVASTFVSLYGGDWEKKLKATESHTNFVHMILLSKKYERAYEDLFLDSDSTKKTNYYRFGWLLFLALRAHVFHLCKDLVTCTHGLICVLAILLMHAPASLRNFNLKDCEHIVMKGDKADLIASLCNMYDTSEDELRKTLEKANSLLAHILKKEARLASDHLPHNLENIVTDGLVYFEDLVDENSLSSSLSLLEKDYETMIQNDWELDERIFIIEKESFLGSGSLSAEPVVMNDGGTKRKLEAIYSPMKTAVKPQLSYLSPIRHLNGVQVGGQSKVLATPVSATMTTAKWLRTVVAPLPPKPSAALEGFLSSCDRDVTSDVTRRAQIILETIFPSGIPGQKPCLMDNRWAEQRRMEAMKLYYKVLLAICTAESQILHANNLTSLLTNERFHRCMLACSAELVLATHKTVTMLFPSVLEKTGITAFDMSKVIESFIRHEESLPRELRRHLNSLEERLLESMVWEKGSSMYNSLIVARPSLSAEISRLGLLAEPMPSLDEIAMHTGTQGGALPLLQPHSKQEKNGNGQDVDIQSPKRMRIEQRSILVDRNSFTSPVKDRLLVPSNLKSKFPPHVLLSVFASPTRPNPGGAGETCAETAVNVFFGKISKLAAVRINSMVERLQLSAQIKESVYCLFQKILSQRTSLFFNRHIDQIILCCFYGVAKISQFKLTFKEIIFDYRKQAPCKPQVFRSVYIDWTSLSGEGKSGPDRVDIITFYNEVFIPAVKPLLVELAPNGSPQSCNNGSVAGPKNHLDGGFLPASPKTSKFPPLPDMSPKKVSSVHNVYVSPLRSSKKDALISHSSKSFYACVGESTRAFQSPSKDLNAINNRLNGTLKRRGALNFDEVDAAGLVTDSVVATTLQNGGSSSSSPPMATIKSEQPDS